MKLKKVAWCCRATKETLAAMGKIIKQAGEAAKVKVRQARKSAVDLSKDLPSEDDQKKAEKQVHVGAVPESVLWKFVICFCSCSYVHMQVQKMTDQVVVSIDKICSAKEKELHVL
jgi:ribosome recycling factor